MCDQPSRHRYPSPLYQWYYLAGGTPPLPPTNLDYYNLDQQHASDPYCNSFMSASFLSSCCLLVIAQTSDRALDELSNGNRWSDPLADRRSHRVGLEALLRHSKIFPRGRDRLRVEVDGIPRGVPITNNIGEVQLPFSPPLYALALIA